MAFDPNFQGVSVFVDVNELGEIRNALIGKAIIPDKQYNFFFYVEEEVANDIKQYKVEMEGLKANLVKIKGVN